MVTEDEDREHEQGEDRKARRNRDGKNRNQRGAREETCTNVESWKEKSVLHNAEDPPEDSHRPSTSGAPVNKDAKPIFHQDGQKDEEIIYFLHLVAFVIEYKLHILPKKISWK